MPERFDGSFHPEESETEPDPANINSSEIILPAPENQEEETIDPDIAEIVQQRFHPHPELPEDMPEFLSNVGSKLAWHLMRTGLGNVINPSGLWDDAAKYYSSLLNDESAQPQGTASSHGHNFTTMQILIDYSPEVLTRSIYSYKQGGELEFKTDTRKILKEIIHEVSSELSIVEACEELAARLQDNQEKRLPSIEEGREVEIMGLQKSIKEKTEEFKKNPDDTNPMEQAIILAKQWESMTNIPWWSCFFIGYSDKIIEFITSKLDEVEGCIFQDCAATGEIPFRLHPRIVRNGSMIPHEQVLKMFFRGNETPDQLEEERDTIPERFHKYVFDEKDD